MGVVEKETRTEAVRIGLVHADARTREFLRMYLEQKPGVDGVRIWGSTETFWRDGAGRGKLEVLFVGPGLPGAGGMELIGMMVEHYPATRVCLLGGGDADEELVRALRLGVMGHVSPANPEEVYAATRIVHGGGAFFSPGASLRLARHFNGTPTGRRRLTGRERQVLEGIVGGQSATRIAGLLHISPHTVRYHTKNLYTKLGVRGKTALVRRAYELGLI